VLNSAAEPVGVHEMATTSLATLFEQFPVPTLERPFGVHLWPIFSKAFEKVVGYPAEDFRFRAGVTPMSTIKETSIFIVIYYAVIFGGRELMRNREPFKLRTPFLVHNFYLTAISGILLALFIEQLLATVVRNGIFYSICHRDGGWTQPLVVLYYVRCIASQTTYFIH
jgi:fatty acid elongase 3